MKLKTVLIDDEYYARVALKSLLASHESIDVIGEADNVAAAEKLIEQLRPDLIFLDISMPDGTGFDLLERISVFPHIIFVTAYDKYAVQAFETSAVAYLLKPINPDKLVLALNKIPPPDLSIDPDRRFFIKDNNNYYFLYLNDILLVQRTADKTLLFLQDREITSRLPLNYFESRFTTGNFFRANRNELINVNYITFVKPFAGDYLIVEIANRLLVELSERQTTKFREKFDLLS